MKLFGDDFDTLRTNAAKIQRVLEAIPGAADVVTITPTTLQVLGASTASYVNFASLSMSTGGGSRLRGSGTCARLIELPGCNDL